MRHVGSILQRAIADIDYIRLFTPQIAQAYSILVPGGFLSAGDKTIIAAKLLNDNTAARLTELIPPPAPTRNAAGTGTLTASGTTVTIAGGDTSQFAVGGVILNTSNTGQVVITSVTDATHFVVNNAVVWAGTSFNYARPWQTGDCGLIWLEKHRDPRSADHRRAGIHVRDGLPTGEHLRLSKRQPHVHGFGGVYPGRSRAGKRRRERRSASAGIDQLLIPAPICVRTVKLRRVHVGRRGVHQQPHRLDSAVNCGNGQELARERS